MNNNTIHTNNTKDKKAAKLFFFAFICGIWPLILVWINELELSPRNHWDLFFIFLLGLILLSFWKITYHNIRSIHFYDGLFLIKYPRYLPKMQKKGKIADLEWDLKGNSFVFKHKKKMVAKVHLAEITDTDRIFLKPSQLSPEITESAYYHITPNKNDYKEEVEIELGYVFLCISASRFLLYNEMPMTWCFVLTQAVLLFLMTYQLCYFIFRRQSCHIKEIQLSGEKFSIEYSIYFSRKFSKGFLKDITLVQKSNRLIIKNGDKILAKIPDYQICEEDKKILSNSINNGKVVF